MPVSTGQIGEPPRAKRCKHCDESSHRGGDTGSGFWQIQLDRDLVDTIAAIYPEWVKGANSMAEGGPPVAGKPRAATSPPKVLVDTSPLVNKMEQNKQSLKVKLMLRRPINQLVAQGIMPPLKTPPAFHEQRRQLERAKTGDMLKAKIQQRPARHELEMRHILEAEPAVDPSLVEKQRMLKKARLADQLNDQLSHRPGPLELIQKNILHTEEPIEEAVKAGRIPFRATCEGQITKPQHPNSYVTYEDDSQSSEGDTLVSPGPVHAPDVLEAAAKSAGIVVSLAIPASQGTVVVTTATPLFKDNSDGGLVFADLCHTVTAPTTLLPLTSVPSPGSLVSSTSTLSPLSSVASPVPAHSQSITSAPPTPLPIALTPKPQASPARSDAPGKDKNRKKSKSKSAPKTRTIKFHEYKGPPNAQKNPALSTGSPGETSYELLLKQQQLFLQWQLQLQHKYPQIILPAAQKPMLSESTTAAASPQQQQQTQPPAITAEALASVRLTSRLEDMKVSDLKAELKRRNLPVSGSKPQLIERLKPFTSTSSTAGNGVDTQSVADTSAPMSVCSEESQTDVPDEMSGGSPQSVDEEAATMEMCENISLLQHSQEDLVREQQKRIEELQRKLTLSQLQLQQVRSHPADHKAQRCIALQQHIQAKRQQHQMAMHVQQIQALQQLQAEQEQRQRLVQQQQQQQQQQDQQQQQRQQQQQQRQQQQQDQHVAFQNSKNLTNGLLLNTASATIVLNQLMQGKVKLVNGQTRANSLPNFLTTVPVISAAPEIQTTQPTPAPAEAAATADVKPPPPLYEEATKQIKKENSNVKSQIVDDVLEILIKNGELPPSAAHDPSLTPSSAGARITEESVFPPAATVVANDNTTDSSSLGLDAAVLQDFELDLDSLDRMDFTQLEMDLNMGPAMSQHDDEYDQMGVPMDTDDDSDWLDSLLPVEQPQHQHQHQQHISLASVTPQFDSEMSTYDPLLGNSDDPFDLFSLDDFKSPASPLTWDKVDFAA